MPSYVWDTAEGKYRNLLTGFVTTPGDGGGGEPDPNPGTQAHDWSDTNLPWAYTSTSQFTDGWPADTQIVDIQTGSSDFYTNLKNTVDAAGRRVVVRLGEDVYRLNQFRMIGTSGSPTYAFGFWFPNLQGLVGQGPDKTFVQMDANSMSQAQLDQMATMTSGALGNPLQMGLARLDSTDPNSPILVGGLTFRAADQQMLTSTAVDNIVVPQPAPHNGIVLHPGSHMRMQYVRFQGAGRACNSMPPFECSNMGSQYGNIRYYKCEFDGRRSPDLDPARPRRCGVIMGNNEDYHLMEDCWIHHSNVSRYAVNDTNRATTGQYILTRTKVEQISNNNNTDPALNNGQPLLGDYAGASSLGWESVGGTITLNDCIVIQDNPDRAWVSTTPQHLQLTSVGRNPAGGRMYVNGGEFRDLTFPEIDGFLRVWADDGTHWYSDGLNTTLHMYNKAGQRLQPHIMDNLSPSNWAQLLGAELASQGKTPETHYLVMNL